jgi:hypothetical protein
MQLRAGPSTKPIRFSLIELIANKSKAGSGLIAGPTACEIVIVRPTPSLRAGLPLTSI